MSTDSLRRRRIIILGSVAIAVLVLVMAGAFAGSYALGLSALHNRNNLSVQQACTHWDWIWTATAHDGTTALHKAVGRTLGQLGCAR